MTHIMWQIIVRLLRAFQLVGDNSCVLKTSYKIRQMIEIENEIIKPH